MTDQPSPDTALARQERPTRCAYPLGAPDGAGRYPVVFMDLGMPGCESHESYPTLAKAQEAASAWNDRHNITGGQIDEILNTPLSGGVLMAGPSIMLSFS